jgi:hypothetical protein
MPAKNYISKREHKLLINFAFVVFLFVLLFISLSIINDFNYSVSEVQKELKSQASPDEPRINLSGGSGLTFFPLFQLLTFFIFVALFKAKRFLLPFLLTIFYTFIFIYALSARFKGRQLGGEEFSPQVDLHEQLYYASNGYDFFSAIFILILLFWQISILLRMLIKTSQKENVLP